MIEERLLGEGEPLEEEARVEKGGGTFAQTFQTGEEESGGQGIQKDGGDGSQSRSRGLSESPR